jgi:hypothetical protein
MRRPYLLFVCAWLALAALPGCGPDVDELCEELDQECDESVFGYDLDEGICTEEGEQLEERADEADCDDAFDDYLDCVDSVRCNWHTRCLDLRNEITLCIARSGSAR